MSAEASDMSSYLLMGVPGLAYLTGLADATWTAIGLALGTYLNWLIVAKKIRLYSHGYQAITLPDYFSKRFGDDKHVITLISAKALIVIFFIPYTASGFAACGKLFNSLLGFDYHAKNDCQCCCYCTFTVQWEDFLRQVHQILYRVLL